MSRCRRRRLLVTAGATAVPGLVAATAGAAAAGLVAVAVAMVWGVLRWRSIEDRVFASSTRRPATWEAPVACRPESGVRAVPRAGRVVMCLIEVSLSGHDEGDAR